MSNSLVPEQAGSPPPPSSSAPPSILDAISTSHGMASEMFDKTSETSKQALAVRNELAELSRLGDTVTPEDVIEGAGKLVGQGLDPIQMARMLAEMPQGSEALAGWVNGHLQTLEQQLPQLAQLHAVARHELGVSALRGIMAHAAGHEASPGSSPSPELAGPAPTGSA